MLYRDEYYHADSPEQGTVELIIAKQRNGPTGKVRLAFNAERGQFDDISKLKS
jgi:replicative DNA helicase